MKKSVKIKLFDPPVDVGPGVIRSWVWGHWIDRKMRRASGKKSNTPPHQT